MHTTDKAVDIFIQYKIVYFNKMFVGLNVHYAWWSIIIQMCIGKFAKKLRRERVAFGSNKALWEYYFEILNWDTIILNVK